MPAHNISFYLNASDDLRSLAGEARRIAQLQQIFLKTAPQSLTQACCVKQLRAGTLFLVAENAAIAAKLKQLAPRLLSSYQKQGLEVTSIRVEVQVRERAPDTNSRPAPKRLSLETIDNLEALAAGLEASPLKQALTRLAARQRNSS
jgi:hypothetical protein